MGVAHVLPRTASSFEESTFAAALPDFDSNGQEFYCFDIDLGSVGQGVIENQNIHNTPWKKHKQFRGLRSDSTVSWAEYLTASGTHAAEGAFATATQLSTHLRAAWGGRTLNRAAGLASSTGSTVTVDTGEGTNFKEGDLIYAYDDSAAAGEWLVVQSKSTDTLTVDRAFPFTATTSDTIKGVVQCFPDWLVATDHSNASHKTLAMAFKGVDSEDYWHLLGVKPAVEMDAITQNQAPILRFSAMVTSFEHEGLTPDDIDGAPEGQAPLAVGTGDSCRFFLAKKSGALAEVDSSTIQVRFGITQAKDAGPNGHEGVHGYVAQGFEGGGLDCSVRFKDEFAEDFRADEVYHALIQIGDGEEDSVCLYFPYLEFSAEPARTGSDNIYSQLTFRAMENLSSTSLTGADKRRWIAPFHIGMVA